MRGSFSISLVSLLFFLFFPLLCFSLLFPTWSHHYTRFFFFVIIPTTSMSHSYFYMAHVLLKHTTGQVGRTTLTSTQYDLTWGKGHLKHTYQEILACQEIRSTLKEQKNSKRAVHLDPKDTLLPSLSALYDGTCMNWKAIPEITV